MVSPVLFDTILDPSKELRELFVDQDHNGFGAIVERHFKQILLPHEAFYQIPPLNISRPPTVHRQRSIVRFVAMVQDTSREGEVYMGVLDDKSCGGWGLYEEMARSQSQDEEQSAVDYSRLQERDSVWAVTVPGQSIWSRDAVSGPDFPPPTVPTKYTCPKPLKNPGGDIGAFGVSLKIYHDQGNLKPGEVKTFVGILDEEPSFDDMEEESQPIPTLHVLFTVDALDTDPYNFSSLRDTLFEANIRANLLQWIADEALGGDTEAATWVLLTALTKVQSRTPPILPLSVTIGSFSDSLDGASNIPTLVHVLRQLIPTVSPLQLTLDTLNGKPFMPTSVDEDVQAGILQHPAGTMFIVSESGIKEGKVTEAGMKNLAALQSVISTQTLSYVFPYSSFSFPVDFSFLSLTKGRKSAFLTTDVVVPLKGAKSGDELARELYKGEDEVHLPPKATLEKFRSYISSCRTTTVMLDDDVGKFIEDEFVRTRQDNSDAVSSDDLVRRMSIAKLLSASMMQPKLTKETWKLAVTMDEKAKSGR